MLLLVQHPVYMYIMLLCCKSWEINYNNIIPEDINPTDADEGVTQPPTETITKTYALSEL